MKEKDRLRKEYVEELRKRHEEEASRLETQLAKEQRARREEQAARVEVEHVASQKKCCALLFVCPLMRFTTLLMKQLHVYLFPGRKCLMLSCKWQVERDLERSKKELKKELEHARAVADQDHAHRERFDLCKKKLMDMVEASETLHGMASDLEESTAHMKVQTCD